MTVADAAAIYYTSGPPPPLIHPGGRRGTTRSLLIIKVVKVISCRGGRRRPESNLKLATAAEHSMAGQGSRYTLSVVGRRRRRGHVVSCEEVEWKVLMGKPCCPDLPIKINFCAAF